MNAWRVWRRGALWAVRGRGYTINGEGVREGSVMRSHLEESKNTAGHSGGQAGLARGVCKGAGTELTSSFRGLARSRDSRQSELAKPVRQREAG